MRALVVLPCLLLLCSLLSGCFGGAVVYSKTKNFDEFSLGLKGDVRSESKKENPTEAKVEELWGKPDSKRNEKEGVIVWRYKEAWSMAGLFPMVVIPIPLIVPTGSDYIDIYFKNEAAVKAHTSLTDCSGGYFGPADESTSKMTFNKARW